MTNFTQNLFISHGLIDTLLVTEDEQGLSNRFDSCWHFNFEPALPDGEM
jgi:hypothetical protein